jgi:DNA topoisomerase-1
MPPIKYKSSKILVIVESYAKSIKIQDFLDSKYKCVYTLGHFREIDTDYQTQIFNTFTPIYKITASKKKLVSELRTHIKESNHIIIATDDDREGEAIAWHICDTFGLDSLTTKRILFHEVTKEAIVKAIYNHTTINMNLVRSQQTRQIIDLLIGFKVSPVIWDKVINNKTLSAGRCQTPALHIIYDNHMKRRGGGEFRYDVSALFTSYNILFHLNHSFHTEEESIEFLNKTKTFDHMYDINPINEFVVAPPLPYSTVDILKSSPYSSKETMKICQTLYEEGLITYHRTDSRKISQAAVKTVAEYISKNYGGHYVGAKKENDIGGDVLEHAHEAIRPVDICIKEAGRNPKEKKIYGLIWNRTVESCMTDYKYTEQEAVMTAPDDNIYSHVHKETVFDGWKKVQGVGDGTKLSGGVKNAIHLLRNFAKDKPVSWNHVYCKMEYVSNTSHLSESNLVSILEEKGIGRPSTYASIVEKIQEKGYVKCMNLEGEEKTCIDIDMDKEGNVIKKKINKVIGKEKNKLIIQDVGIKTIEYLYDHFHDIFDYGYTRHMELELDKISCGVDCDGKEMYMTCYKKINNIVENLL